MAVKRSTTPTKVPNIPAVPQGITPELRRYLTSLSEAVEVRLGRRGDQRDRAVTVRELVGSGLATEKTERPFLETNSDSTTGIGPGASTGTLGEIVNVDVPSAPTGFTATGGYELIQLYWDVPTYSGHSLTEIWRHTADVIGSATLIGVAGGSAYVDAVGENQTYYYWIRHVNINAQIGPYNASAGTVATTSPSVDLLIDTLQRTNGTETAVFYEQTTPIVVDGITIPAGVYITNGYIRDLSVTNAQIANLAVDNAKIANLDAAKITTGELNANRISVDGATIVRNASGQLQVDELSANQIVAGTIDASVVNVANLNAANITSGTLTSGRIDVTDLLLPTGGGSVTGSSIGAFSTTNVAETKLVTSIGTGLGYYQGYVRIVGGTNHLKSVRLLFATSNTSTTGNTIYTTPLTATLPGHIDRFFSSSDSQNIPLAFVNSAVDGPIYLWVEATPDSAPDEFGLIEARFLRFGTGSSVYAYGAWSSYQYSRTTAPLYYWRVNVQSSTDLLYWNNTTISPITGGGDIGTSTSIFAGDGYQYERGTLQFQEYDTTGGAEPVVFLKALYYNVRRRTYSST